MVPRLEAPEEVEMSRSRSSVSPFAASALLLATLFVVTPALAGTTPAPASPQAKANAVQTALQGIDGRLDRLEADINRAEHVAASPPALFSRELEQLRWQIDEQTRNLIGLHWTVANPVLDEAGQLSGRIKDFEGRLENWQPSLPPDPNRPLKTSAATGAGAITGTLTDQANGNPIPYTRVEVYCPDPSFDAETMTGPDGVYTMSGLGTGNCYVRTWNQLSYIDELYDDIPCTNYCYMGDGTPVPVVDGQTTTGIDFALQLGGEIRGTLTNAEDGSPLGSAYVELFDASGDWYAEAATDSGGHYRVDVVPAGSYFAETTLYGDWYLNELYNDIQCPDWCDPTTGTPIAVTSGQITDRIDFALEPAGAISGSVVESGSGAPLDSVKLSAYDTAGSLVGYIFTDSTGVYTLPKLIPGTYFVVATHDTHMGGLYEDIPCPNWCDPTTGTSIQVVAGATTPNIDFALDRLPTVSGTVLDSVSGSPLENALVYFYSASGYLEGSTYCDLLGDFTYGELEPGTHYATAAEYSHITELYQEISCPFDCDPTGGTPITLTLGTDVTGIDFTLNPESRIIGTVTAATGVAPDLPFISVYDTAGTQVGYTFADTAGQFEINQLPAGSFFAMAEDWGIWVDQVYDGIDCPDGCDPTAGTPIVTAVGGTTEISFSLTAFGQISGQVTDAASRTPIENAQVAAYDLTGSIVSQFWTDSNGLFQIQGLQTGTYFILTSHNAYHDELYDNIPCDGGCDVTTGTPISVTIGSDTSIDIALDRKGSISGHLTDALNGQGVFGVAQAYDEQGTPVATAVTESTSSGAYSLQGLPAGTYYVAVSSSYGYLKELYDNIPCNSGCDVTTGTPVIVTDGVNTPNIDFALEPVQIFDDVPVGYWARYWIQTLYSAGITSGCATDPPLFCPGAPVTRNQMAKFLLKSKEGRYYTPPPAIGIFNDVPINDPFAPWIEELAARAITAGCSADPPLFCPNAPLTRNQMAKFLLRTLEGPLYQPPAAVGVFDDVPVDNPFAPWIEDLAARGITAGCSANPPLFCPDATVSRAQMAVFLVKTFNLQE